MRLSRHVSDYQLEDRSLSTVVYGTLAIPVKKGSEVQGYLQQYHKLEASLRYKRPCLKKVKTKPKQKKPFFQKGQGMTPFLPLIHDAFLFAAVQYHERNPWLHIYLVSMLPLSLPSDSG